MAETATAIRGPDILLRTAPPLSAVSDEPLAPLPVPPASASNDPTDLKSGVPGEISPENQAATQRARKPAEVKAAPDKPGLDDDLKEIEADGRKIASPPWFIREVTKARNIQRAAEAKLKDAEAKLADAEKSRVPASEVEELRAKIAELTAKAETAATKTETVEAAAPKDLKPSRDQFDDPDAYDTALTAWATREGERAAADKIAKQQREESAARQAKADVEARSVQEAVIIRTNETWEAKRAAAMEKYEDYAAVVESDALVISPPMAHAIFTAENGADIAYYLGKNPDESARIAALGNPAQQVFQLGLLAARLAQPAARGQRPRPLEPLDTGSAPADTSEREPSMEEVASRVNTRMLATRRPFMSPDTRH